MSKAAILCPHTIYGQSFYVKEIKLAFEKPIPPNPELRKLLEGEMLARFDGHNAVWEIEQDAQDPFYKHGTALTIYPSA